MERYQRLSKLNSSVNYKNIVRFLTNETLDQAIFMLNPSFVNNSTGCAKLENKCIELVRLMG